MVALMVRGMGRVVGRGGLSAGQVVVAVVGWAQTTLVAMLVTIMKRRRMKQRSRSKRKIQQQIPPHARRACKRVYAAHASCVTRLRPLQRDKQQKHVRMLWNKLNGRERVRVFKLRRRANRRLQRPKLPKGCLVGRSHPLPPLIRVQVHIHRYKDKAKDRGRVALLAVLLVVGLQRCYLPSLLPLHPHHHHHHQWVVHHRE
jgi:hypothetical protein